MCDLSSFLFLTYLIVTVADFVFGGRHPLEGSNGDLQTGTSALLVWDNVTNRVARGEMDDNSGTASLMTCQS